MGIDVLCSNSKDGIMQQFLLSAIRQIGPKFFAASFLAFIIAIASGSSLKLGLRYFAATSMLISLCLAVLAVVRRPSGEEPLSDWEQAIIFSVIAGVAHFLAAF
jgi:hypothetical protein